MGSASKFNAHLKFPAPPSQPLLLCQPESSSNSRKPSTSSDTEEKNPKNFKIPKRSIPSKESKPSDAPLTIDGSKEDALLRNSEFLTQEELLRRRSRRAKQLARYYRSQYWGLMEEVRIQYREYYWKYGKSPFDEEEEKEEESGVRSGINGSVEVNGDDNRLGFGLGFSENSNGNKINVHNKISNISGCVFPGCKAKAMALTNYCHPHILSDTKQTLYKACSYVTKSAQTGLVTCGKPVLRAAAPSLCTVHFQKAQKHVSRALKKAGLNIASSSKPAPKFHVIIAEYVCQIQAKRRKARRVCVEHAIVKEENHN